MITQTRLKELLDYDPETGVFTWREYRQSSTGAGDIAGTTQHAGYILISIDNRRYYGHRLAHLWMEGYFPEYCIDHVNRNPSDNRWENLREVSHGCNMRNMKIPKNNTSGVKGVTWCKKKGKWQAQVTVDYKCVYLGRYDDFNNAVLARLEAERRLGWSKCDSSSPAFQYAIERGLI